ncbi:papain fold toxin domain-containing protein [Nostoc sp. 106C]|uniref:papain fold toxin domain-containing protein n=1 Tax=Nostoc sp. 106C TaxID=1932667 RepID=UPI000A3A4068|nr:papain fold toxin domain-containing protein [Nostoc sp. 106C]OUL23707.1 hypothetical protein BV375_25385 [Nostoc sp. 106C]
MTNSQLRQQISEIAEAFPLFECIQCANAIQTFLLERGIAGKRLQLFTGSNEEPYCNIYHEILQQNISTNGIHEAIAVEIAQEELIFDNIHSQGVQRQVWLNNLYCAAKDIGGDFQITETDF